MNKSADRNSRGVSVKVVHAAMILCALVTAALLIFSTYQTSEVVSGLSTETGNYIVRQKAAHALMEASDYLTENVQRFTLDGERVYMDNYFEEAYVSKRREASILAMSENNADPTLVRRLQEAMDESQALMYREYYAMRLVVDAQGIQDYPDTLKAIEINQEDLFLTAEEKMDRARDLVMGAEYYASKENIRSRLKTDLEILDDQMAATRQETSARMVREVSAVRVIVIAVALLLLGLTWLTARICTQPLLSAVKSARKKEPVPAIGSREFREMAEHFNAMMYQLHPEMLDETEETEADGEE